MIIVWLGLLGLVLGSFVNALVWRLHEQEELREQKAELSKKKGSQKKLETLDSKLEALSVTKGRSMCPSCHHTLTAKDLVPVVSWLALRGKCRYCKARIPDSPLVELTTALLFALSYVSWPLALTGLGAVQFGFWLVFVVFFVALAVYDLRWFLLPNKLVFPLVALAGLQVLVVAVAEGSWAALWQPVAAAGVIFGLFYGLFQVSKGQWIGGGDVKLALALGLIVGTPVRAFMVIFFASLLGTLVSLPLLAQGKKGLKVHIPFGPYLLVATAVVVLYGADVVDWYTKLFLPAY
jgi:prepilin signal peptidase PulO-like enzyme (type II secretory pathway)